ncbi:MAG TPA: hypothetical protein VFE14_06325, partial [Micromonosporaceae bacterium]|nr:hypothetical protein [Micromonosporaceae bacterium]
MTATTIDVPYGSVLVAWSLLLGGAFAALLGLALLARRADKANPASGTGFVEAPPAGPKRRHRPTAQDCARLRAEAVELHREALATGGKAGRARVAATEARARHAAAQAARDAALQTLDTAQ